MSSKRPTHEGAGPSPPRRRVRHSSLHEPATTSQPVIDLNSKSASQVQASNATQLLPPRNITPDGSKSRTHQAIGAIAPGNSSQRGKNKQPQGQLNEQGGPKAPPKQVLRPALTQNLSANHRQTQSGHLTAPRPALTPQQPMLVVPQLTKQQERQFVTTTALNFFKSTGELGLSLETQRHLITEVHDALQGTLRLHSIEGQTTLPNPCSTQQSRVSGPFAPPSIRLPRQTAQSHAHLEQLRQNLLCAVENEFRSIKSQLLQPNPSSTAFQRPRVTGPSFITLFEGPMTESLWTDPEQRNKFMDDMMRGWNVFHSRFTKIPSKRMQQVYIDGIERQLHEARNRYGLHWTSSSSYGGKATSAQKPSVSRSSTNPQQQAGPPAHPTQDAPPPPPNQVFVTNALQMQGCGAGEPAASWQYTTQDLHRKLNTLYPLFYPGVVPREVLGDLVYLCTHHGAEPRLNYFVTASDVNSRWHCFEGVLREGQQHGRWEADAKTGLCKKCEICTQFRIPTPAEQHAFGDGEEERCNIMFRRKGSDSNDGNGAGKDAGQEAEKEGEQNA